MLIASCNDFGHHMYYVRIGETHCLCRLYKSGNIPTLPEERVEREATHLSTYSYNEPLLENGDSTDTVDDGYVACWYLWYWLQQAVVTGGLKSLSSY